MELNRMLALHYRIDSSKMFTRNVLRSFRLKKKVANEIAARLISEATAQKLSPSAVKILFGSQTGTSQQFATQLADEITSKLHVSSVHVSGLHEASPEKLLAFDQSSQEEQQRDDALIFLLACFGTGQPTDNAKTFVQWLNSGDEAVKALIENRNYAVFGLGNSRTHVQNYNIVGKNTDAKLEELGGNRLQTLGLGDDSGCIEEDFDAWSTTLIETLSNMNDASRAPCTLAPNVATGIQAVTSEGTVEGGTGAVCLGDLALEEKPLVNDPSLSSCSFRQIILNDCYPDGRKLKKDLFDCCDFYAQGTSKLKIVSNKVLAPCQESLREAVISLDGNSEVGAYDVGDLIWIYPQNHPAQVAAYANAVNANPFAIIEGVKESGLNGNAKPRPYPYPLGLTVSETLQHCVDLSATPSLSLARNILGHNVDFKSMVDEPRRTTLELLLEPGSKKLSLGELLFQLPPMRPRYYSIASSPVVHPNEIIVVYRPLKYITSRGVLREGVATSYLNKTVPAFDDDEDGERRRAYIPSIAAGIMRNTGFRLPQDPSTPIIMIAGGCGIAPFRSFLDERLAVRSSIGEGATSGEAYLFLGVRHENDEVYIAIIEHALSAGVLTKAIISHSNSCCNSRFVSSDIDAHGALVYDLLERGGNVYLCGGASGLAWTSSRAIKAIIAEHGKMSGEEAENYFTKLLQDGRYAEDISD